MPPRLALPPKRAMDLMSKIHARRFCPAVQILSGVQPADRIENPYKTRRDVLQSTVFIDWLPDVESNHELNRPSLEFGPTLVRPFMPT